MFEHLFTVIAWVAFFMFCVLLVLYGIRGSDFERKCEVACSPSRVITPVISGEDACLCDEGHGIWRRQIVNRDE